MKKTGVMIGALIFFLMISTSATAVFSSTYTLKGTLDGDTSVFFLGKTAIIGNSPGLPMEQIIDSPLVQEMNAFPLVAASTIANLDSVIVVEDVDITKTPSLEELYRIYADHITEYSDVTITTSSGVFLLGIDQGTMHVSTRLPYAITSFLPFEITPNFISRFFVTATLVPITIQCTGNFSVLARLSNTGTLQIQDTHRQILWTGGANNTYLVFHKNVYSVIQQPPLFLFPLHTSSSAASLSFSITPADNQDISMEHLIKNVSGIVQNLGDLNSKEIVNTFTALHDFSATTCLITNGAMFLLQTNDTITIDETSQQFSKIGFARFSSLNVVGSETSEGPTIQGDSNLVFLGNHFYNTRSKHSSNGTAFPFEIVILWIVALCVFLSVHFFLRREINEYRTNWLKRYAFIFHIILLAITILLLDFEVYGQFGISAFTALFTQGFCTIASVFILVELIMWVLGYLLFAIPIRILLNSGLRFLGIGKAGNGIGKGIGVLSIWVFCGLYLILILNIIISFIHFDVFPMVG
jgi:hypothetical protein